MRETLLAVEEALRRILDIGAFEPNTEYVDLWQAQGRFLSADLPAQRTQPPFDASAMDGYAIRHADSTAPLQVIGESAAGHSFAGVVGHNQAVRIFTGAPVPHGADTVILQENVSRNGTQISVLHAEPLGRHIRTAGLDFVTGQILLSKGTKLGVRELALAAAMNHASLPVAYQPRVGILATGDELAFPGENAADDTIICSNSYSTAALVRQAGGIPVNLGIARDNFAALEAGIRRAQAENVDILVTLGGASVGDHDLVQKALANEGMALAFWKIAMRPGKPLMHGSLGKMRILGLPGNPVASIVCGLLYLQPLIRALSGDLEPARDISETAILGAPLKANDQRQDYLRATLSEGEPPVVRAFEIQDSSMLSTLAASQCLILRTPFAPPAEAGEMCRIIRLE
jgi:molybdopterin molybdotransferase